MSLARTQGRLELPETLRAQLLDFRRRVWTVKTAEAALAAAFIMAIAFLILFGIDRAWETPGWPRWGLFILAVAGLALIPIALYRWVWKNRRPDQLARLVARTHPRAGDQLLGVIELVRSDLEQARSRALCEAAIRQAAEDSQGRDFRDAVPRPKHRLWAALLVVPLAVVLGLAFYAPAAASNAWARLARPWSPISRYTFAAVDRLPAKMIVAHGEPFRVTVRLRPGTVWRPKRGQARFGSQPSMAATLQKNRYVFTVPPQIAAETLDLHIGDFRQRIQVVPTLRPELTAAYAEVTLPDYLGRPTPQRKDVRNGSVALLKGSQARVAATVSRALASATVDGRSIAPSGATVTAPPVRVDAPRSLEFRWQDRAGLTGKAPFTLAITGRDDEPPSLACENLPRQKVVLDSEVIGFKIAARDDYGVKRIGLVWKGIDPTLVKTPAQGETLLAAGGHDRESVDADGTFSAKALGIEPQPIQVRAYVEDYAPGRDRVYSPPSTFYVLSAEQHAIWVTEQLSRWHRQSLEIRDRELQLHETNKQLRSLSAEDLDRPENRRRIENQAAAERGNGRRLAALVGSGEDLVRQAARNPEIGVGHLETWAQMLQILKDISGNRMPSVADLLKQAAQSPSPALASNPTGNRTRLAGQARAAGSGAPAEIKKNAPPSAVPQVTDLESSQKGPEKNAEAPGLTKKNGSTPRLLLPQTTVLGQAGANKPPPPPPPPTTAAAKVDEAIKAQQDLLAEFDRIAEELNRVLANLEGSTLVKRLKAASRVQTQVAGRLGDQVGETFGLAEPRLAAAPAKRLDDLATRENEGSQNVSVIMDDLQAYFERRAYARFKSVLDEMRALDVVGSLRQIGVEVKRESGASIAQCEYWSDTLDRWADDLIDPASSGTCPGSRSKGSLPPSIILEVLQILESEVNLRDQTRVAQQGRPALTADDFQRKAGTLAEAQKGLNVRVIKVRQRIRDLPDAEAEFAYEIKLLSQVAGVMYEATGILNRPETGNPAVAVETEAIELLLKSRRINPKAGGGGGSDPGGGGTGSTNDSALALIGTGLNEKEVREDHGIAQSTGESGPALPEEFRSGLDEYFNRLEREPGGQ